MTELTDSGGSDPAPATTHADGLPTGGQSLTAARALQAPAVNRAARMRAAIRSSVATLTPGRRPKHELRRSCAEGKRFGTEATPARGRSLLNPIAS